MLRFVVRIIATFLYYMSLKYIEKLLYYLLRTLLKIIFISILFGIVN